MMIERLQQAHFSAWIIGPLLGAFAAFMVSPTIPTWNDIYWRYFDKWHPPATINVRRLPSPPGEVRAEMTTVRHRNVDECKVKRVETFETLPDGNTIRVPNSGRIDGLALIDIPVGVRYRSEWRFWPVGIGVLSGWVEYICDGRKVVVPMKGLS